MKIETIIFSSLFIWSLYFLWNHDIAFSKLKEKIKRKLPEIPKKVLECAFCFGFWNGVILALFTRALYIPLVIAPIVLFLELIFFKLVGEKSTNTEIAKVDTLVKNIKPDINVEVDIGKPTGIRGPSQVEEYVKIDKDLEKLTGEEYPNGMRVWTTRAK